MKMTGTLEIGRDAVRIRMPYDVVDYYRWFIERYYGIRTNGPRHGAHITLTNPKIHGWLNYGRIRKLNGRKIEFDLDIKLRVGGGPKKGWFNFWMPVTCPEGEDIKRRLGITEGKNFIGLHFTIGNTKGIKIPKIINPSLYRDYQLS